MSKYQTVFAISWQDEFTYRLNFILWRVRNVLRFLMTYFLWRGIFVSKSNVFGYSQGQLLTYIFLVLIVVSIVLSSPSGDRIGSEIGRGDLSNYLVKPLSYLKYWFTRDLASKLLNLVFSLTEITLLAILLKPQLNFPYSLENILGSLILVAIAVGIYFFLSVGLRFVAFWTPENTWGLAFLSFTFIETLSGAIFPLDILPQPVTTLLQFTPFPYLIYYPIAIFVGKISGLEMIRIIIQALIWLFLSYKLSQLIWHKGLRVYSSEGR